MADAPLKTLIFPDLPDGGTRCGDCGQRRVDLPAPLPAIEDDFDWLVRDYDSFRLFMMAELAHRFPERRRWTPADMEVVIVELLAAVLDRLSHTLDVVHGEHFLATARRPESVRRLLRLIGYDAVARADPAIYDKLPALPQGETETDEERLERAWRLFPQAMERARAEGPRRIGEQQRMVTLDDHADRLSTHPLVEGAQARLVWTGAWNSVLISVLLDGARGLDTTHADMPFGPELWAAVTDHHPQGLPVPQLSPDQTARAVLRLVVERYRLIGAEVFLEDAVRVPITFWLSVKARPGYFRSEIHESLAEVLSANAGGLFEPGRLGFGADVYASDIIEAAMTVEGIETACLNRFKRMGDGYADRTDDGVIAIADDEAAICLNLALRPEMGLFDVTVLGGETG